MALRRARGGVIRPQRQRSGTNWFRLAVADTAVAAGAKVLVASGVLSNAGINETIRRTRGRFMWSSDQGTAYESSVPAFGIIVVNDLALAAGAASIPGPITDLSDDGWFVWEGAPGLYGVTSQGAATNNSTQYGAVEFDSKAMRKIPEGFGVAFMVEAGPTNALEFSFCASVLTSRQ